ncbi:MAG: c-type cytochrome [Ignavibacteriales bacterium]|nr:c-type cytochrome [Ignavibacteriales bacterium]
MDFLKQLALPQSAAQIEVLHFVMNFVQILFLPFVSYLFGALTLSLYYGRKGRKRNDINALHFAKDVIDHVLPNKSILFLFGVVPYITLVFAYAQLLQGSESISVSILTWGAVFFMAGSAFASSYNSAFKLSSVLETIKQGNEEISVFRTELSEQKRTSGKYSLLFLFVGIFFLFAGTTLASEPTQWSSVTTVVELIFSAGVIVKFLQFVALSLTIATVGTLFFTFSWEGGKKNIAAEYAAFVKSATLPTALISILIQPLFVVLSVIVAPVAGLSGAVFVASVVGIFFLFLTSHYVYAMMKSFESKFAALAFYVLIISIVSVVIADTNSFAGATKKHSSFLAYQYDKHHEELLAAMGISLKVISGEEIFSAKCSACHEFGIKKVGPAYKDVLPKYENDRAKLLSFVLNPQKMDPAFPPMPNQGLKPAEADSIAAYIMRMYKAPK